MIFSNEEFNTALKSTAKNALQNLSEEDAIAVINEYLASGIVSYQSIRAYKIGFRDARHRAAELAAQDDDLHRDIMNLRIKE